MSFKLVALILAVAFVCAVYADETCDIGINSVSNVTTCSGTDQYCCTALNGNSYCCSDPEAAKKFNKDVKAAVGLGVGLIVAIVLVSICTPIAIIALCCYCCCRQPQNTIVYAA